MSCSLHAPLQGICSGSILGIELHCMAQSFVALALMSRTALAVRSNAAGCNAVPNIQHKGKFLVHANTTAKNCVFAHGTTPSRLCCDDTMMASAQKGESPMQQTSRVVLGTVRASMHCCAAILASSTTTSRTIRPVRSVISIKNVHAHAHNQASGH